MDIGADSRIKFKYTICLSFNHFCVVHCPISSRDLLGSLPLNFAFQLTFPGSRKLQICDVWV